MVLYITFTFNMGACRQKIIHFVYNSKLLRKLCVLTMTYHDQFCGSWLHSSQLHSSIAVFTNPDRNLQQQSSLFLPTLACSCSRFHAKSLSWLLPPAIVRNKKGKARILAELLLSSWGNHLQRLNRGKQLSHLLHVWNSGCLRLWTDCWAPLSSICIWVFMSI